MIRRQDQQEGEFKILQIDTNRLDKEWVNQPKYFFDYACQLADAKRALEGLKAELDIVRAEREMRIRKHPEKYKLGDKVTEGSIKCTLEGQPLVKEAQDKILSAKHRVDILQAAVAALDQRKTALENLVKLTLSSYMASPQAPKGMEEQVDSLTKKFIRQRKKD